MSTVVAVALISTLGTGIVAVATGLIALWRENARLKAEHRRFLEQLQADERRIRADTVRAMRQQAAELLRTWIRRHVAIAIDVEFLRVYPDDQNLAQLIDDRVKLMVGPAEEVSVSAILSQFSDAAILEKVQRIEETRDAIRRHLKGPVRDLAGKVPLNPVQLIQLKALWDQAANQSQVLNTMIAELNSRLEQYVIGSDLTLQA
jgi:hypothetical protein